MNKINSILKDFGYNEIADKEEILNRVNEIDYASCEDSEKREKNRNATFHRDSSSEDRLKKQIIADFIIEHIFYERWGLGEREFKILWLENTPDEKLSIKCKVTLISVMKKISKFFPYHFYLVDQNFNKIINKRIIQDDKLSIIKNGKVETNNSKSNNDNENNIDINEFDLLLLDLYLEDKNTKNVEYNGEYFIEFFMKHYPAIPIIVLTKSEDQDEMVKCLNKGADYYLSKKYILQLPLFIHRIYDKYGMIIWLFIENRYRRNLLGNIRYWMHHKNFLWYGDKCYHMIDHSFNHIYDNWVNTNKLFMIIKDKIGEVDDNDRYSFFMAVWLHDIGHKGNERYGEAYQIRDTHGIISGELILQSPNLFNIIEDEEIFPTKCDEYYKDFTFPLGNQNFSVIQIIRDRKTKEAFLSNVEKIALFSIFHKSNAPLTREDGLKMQSKGKFIPSEYFENSDPNNGKLITLEDILEKRNKTNIRGFLEMTSLFRFIDGIDLHKTRVGDESEKKLKLKVINQDREYYLKKLEETTNFLIEKVAKNNSALALQIYNDLFIHAKDKIERQEFKLDQNYKNFIQEKLGTLENYWMILNYASFISVQDGHFDLHNCVEEIDIKTNKSKIAIIYHLNKGITWLLNSTVREMRVGEMTILEKIFGKIEEGKVNQLPYPLDELKAGAVYLKKFLKLENGLIIKLSVPSDKIEEDEEIFKKLNIDFSIEAQTGTFLINREFKIDGSKLTLVN